MDLNDPITISEFFHGFTSNSDSIGVNCSTDLDKQETSNFTFVDSSDGHGESGEFVLPYWTPNGFDYSEYIENDSLHDNSIPQDSVPLSTISFNSHDNLKSSSILLPSVYSPPPITTPLCHPLDVVSLSSSPDLSPDLSPNPSSCDTSHKFSSSVSLLSETESSFPSEDPPITMKDRQSNQDMTLSLQSYGPYGSVFDNLVEDNFIKLSLNDEVLAASSGLRQLELSKYHELAQIVDKLHTGRNFNGPDNQAESEKFQISIVHKHTEKLINTVKSITSFSNLPTADQIVLLKSSFIDLCLIKSLIFIEPETKTVMINGQRMSMERCAAMGNGQFFKLLASTDPALRTDPIINILIMLIFLLNPNITNLQSTFAVRQEYSLTIHLIQKYMELRGFTSSHANYEIKRLICNLENFLLVFNAKQKIQEIVRRHSGYTPQLIAEMLDINGHHHHQHLYHHNHLQQQQA